MTVLLVAIRRIAPGSARRVVEIIDKFLLHYYPDGLPEPAPPIPPTDPVTVPITVGSAEILTLGALPVHLLDAAPAGQVLELMASDLQYSFGTLPYVVGASTLVIRSMDAAGLPVTLPLSATGLLDQTVNAGSAFALAVPATVAEGAPLVLHMEGGEVTGGDGTITLNITYRMVSTPSANPASLAPFKFGVE
jgi:hypothetical protein